MSKYLCKLSKNDINLIKKSPHCLHFFCNDFRNIIDSKKENCKNKKGYRYAINWEIL